MGPPIPHCRVPVQPENPYIAPYHGAYAQALWGVLSVREGGWWQSNRQVLVDDVLPELLRGALGHDGAALHHVVAVADSRREVHELLHQQHGHPTGRQL